MALITFEVGKPYQEFIGKQDGIWFDMDDSGCKIRVLLRNPSNEETYQIKNGELKFGLYVTTGIIFVLVKFGNLHWMDCPFNIHLSMNLSRIMEPGPNEGYSCQIIAADTATGIINTLRYVGLSTRYSVELLKAMKEQMKIPFSKEKYFSNIEEIYASTPENVMVRRSIADCKFSEKR